MPGQPAERNSELAAASRSDVGRMAYGTVLR